MKIEKIAAVLVCYFPDMNEIQQCIESILPQVDKIFIVDNTDKQSLIKNSEVVQKEDKIELIELKENIGIAAAQNIGMKKAFENGYDAIIQFDQDTKPPANLVEELLSGLNQLLDEGEKVAAIGPMVFNRDSKNEYKPLINKGKNVSNFIEKDAIISSGTVIMKEVFEEVGDFESGLFIDVVDFEWCWRARAKGYKSFMYKRVAMEHRFGQRTFPVFKKINLIIPSPIRYYYQYRNFILLLPRSYVPKYWKLRGFVEKLIELVVVPIFVAPRLTRMKYMFKGLKHGLLGITGKFQ